MSQKLREVAASRLQVERTRLVVPQFGVLRLVGAFASSKRSAAQVEFDLAIGLEVSSRGDRMHRAHQARSADLTLAGCGASG